MAIGLLVVGNAQQPSAELAAFILDNLCCYNRSEPIESSGACSVHTAASLLVAGPGRSRLLVTATKRKPTNRLAEFASSSQQLEKVTFRRVKPFLVRSARS